MTTLKPFSFLTFRSFLDIANNFCFLVKNFFDFIMSSFSLSRLTFFIGNANKTDRSSL